MIFYGTPDEPEEPGRVTVTLIADTSRFETAMRRASRATSRMAPALQQLKPPDSFFRYVDRYIVETARRQLTLDVILEVIGLTVDQVWARFYVRGTSHEFASEDAFTNYLVVLSRIRGDRGHAARAAFMQGWAEYRAGDEDVNLMPWHRLIGNHAVFVDGAA